MLGNNKSIRRYAGILQVDLFIENTTLSEMVRNIIIILLLINIWILFYLSK